MATEHISKRDFAAELARELFGRSYVDEKDVVISKLPRLALWKSRQAHAIGAVGRTVIRWWRDTEARKTPRAAPCSATEDWPHVLDHTSQLADAGIIPDEKFCSWGPA